MENRDRELIMKFIKSDIQLRKLYENHRWLDHRIDKLSNRRFLTTGEQVAYKRLKKEKLLGVDRMLSIVRAREAEQVAA